MTERCPWPFPGPEYDWNTDDELGSIVGQLRQMAKAVDETSLPWHGSALRQLAKDVERVRQLLAPQHVQLPADA